MRALTAAMNAAGTVLVLVVMGVILVDIGGRFLFARPLPGTPEIVAMSIAAIVFLQFPSTLRAQRVIAAEGLVEWLGARSVRAEQWLLALHHAAGGAMFAIVCRFVWPLVREAHASQDYYGSLAVFTFPKWPVFAVIAFGSAVMTLQYLLLAGRFARAGWVRRRAFAVDPAAKMLG
jgi:TRAP-type C4-dicarboxylate transport system permease small subunit